MKRYIALLRGINVSGKNKVPMAELKECFEGLGFLDVSTYLNSGNVAFSSASDDKNDLCETVKSAVGERFCLDIPIFVVLQEELAKLLDNAPEWWGNDDKWIYDNLIFIIPPLTYEELYNEIGEPKEELEKIFNYKNAVFWSFSRKDYNKTNWWSRTANSKVSDKITIRTANTVKKIAIM